MSIVSIAPVRSLGLAAALSLAVAASVALAVAQEAPTPEDYVSEAEPPSFAAPEEAVEAFTSALAANDVEGLAALLGLKADLVKANEATMEAIAQIREGVERRLVLEGEGDSRTVEIGDRLWPLPFPIRKFEDGWAFDTFAGIEEIVDRRIGENETETIATMQAALDAQSKYAEADRDGDGVLEFAQNIISSEGQTDGLYWPAGEDEDESPVGAFIAESELEEAKAGNGYFGYRYRILTRQGDNIAGGAHDYVINGNMIAGHALVAWPVRYDETGVHSFVISHHGVLYEADLGADTASKVEAMDSFDPGDEWEVVPD